MKNQFCCEGMRDVVKRMKRRPAGNGMDLESVGKEREEKMA